MDGTGAGAVGAGIVRKHYWTTAEEAALKQGLGSRMTAAECAEALGRSVASISLKARQLNLGRTASGYAATQEVDEQILAVYTGPRERGDVQALAARIGRPLWWVSRRAGQLGLTKERLKPPAWTDQEIEIVRTRAMDGAAAAQKALKAAGFDRTIVAVAKRLPLVDADRLSVDTWSASVLGRLLGVDEKTVVRWIERYGLKAERTSTGWLLRRKDVRRWVIDHAGEVNRQKLNFLWFVDLLARP